MLMLFSSIASASVGADMMSAGAGMTGAGLAAAPSGYGVAAAAGGAAISVAGGAVVAASAQVAATAAGNLHDDAQKKEYYDKAGCESKDATDKISMPTNNNQLKHIFDDKPGHLPVDTPENRALFESIANDPSCYLGPDEHGNVWHARMQSDGSQIWVRTRGTVITDAGVNSTPQSYNPKTGLCRPERPW